MPPTGNAPSPQLPLCLWRHRSSWSADLRERVGMYLWRSREGATSGGSTPGLAPEPDVSFTWPACVPLWWMPTSLIRLTVSWSRPCLLVLIRCVQMLIHMLTVNLMFSSPDGMFGSCVETAEGFSTSNFIKWTLWCTLSATTWPFQGIYLKPYTLTLFLYNNYSILFFHIYKLQANTISWSTNVQKIMFSMKSAKGKTGNYSCVLVQQM